VAAPPVYASPPSRPLATDCSTRPGGRLKRSQLTRMAARMSRTPATRPASRVVCRMCLLCMSYSCLGSTRYMPLARRKVLSPSRALSQTFGNLAEERRSENGLEGEPAWALPRLLSILPDLSFNQAEDFP